MAFNPLGNIFEQQQQKQREALRKQIQKEQQAEAKQQGPVIQKSQGEKTFERAKAVGTTVAKTNAQNKKKYDTAKKTSERVKQANEAEERRQEQAAYQERLEKRKQIQKEQQEQSRLQKIKTKQELDTANRFIDDAIKDPTSYRRFGNRFGSIFDEKIQENNPTDTHQLRTELQNIPETQFLFDEKNKYNPYTNMVNSELESVDKQNDTVRYIQQGYESKSNLLNDKTYGQFTVKIDKNTGKTNGYTRVNYSDYMSADEQYSYLNILGRYGAQAGKQYLKKLEPQLADRATLQIYTDVQKAKAQAHPIITALSPLTRGVTDSYIDNKKLTIDKNGQITETDTEPQFKGVSTKKLKYQALHQGLESHPILSTIYGVADSADNIAVTLLPGGKYIAPFYNYADQLSDSKARLKLQGRDITDIGTLAQAHTEAAVTALSYNLMGKAGGGLFQKGADTAAKKFIANVCGRIVSGAGIGAAQSLVNSTIDTVYGKNQSIYNQLYQYYISEGADTTEANRKAFTDAFIKPSVTSAIAGSLTSALMGLPGDVSELAQAENQAFVNRGREAMDRFNNDIDEFMKQADKFDRDSIAYKLTQRIKGKEDIKYNEIGVLDYIYDLQSGKLDAQINNFDEAFGTQTQVTSNIYSGANAEYDGENINLSETPTKPLSNVLGHETAHRIKDLAPDEFAAYQAKIKESKGFDEAVDNVRAIYKAQNKTISNELAEEEVAADFARRFFSDEKAPNRAERLAGENPTLFDTVYRSIHSLKNKIAHRGGTVFVDDETGISVTYDELAEIEGLLNTSAAKAMENVKNGADNVQGEAKYSIGQITDDTQFTLKPQSGIYDYTKSFEQQLDDWKNGLIPKFDSLLVGATPKVFQKIGFNQLPVTINQQHIDYAINGTKNIDHTIGEALLKQLPTAMQEPIAIIASRTQNSTSLVAMLDMSHNGEQIILPVVIDGYGTQNGIRIDSNAVTSVYARNKSIKMLTEAINDEANGKPFSVYYLDTKKATALSQRARVTMPKSFATRSDGFIHSITEKGSPVKPKFKNVTETQQFIRWFGDWKNHPNSVQGFTNPDGTPKHLYHGTNRFGFTEFKDGPIFLTDNPNIAAGYGRTGYADVRNVREYNPDNTDTAVIENAKNILNMNLREVTKDDVKQIRTSVLSNATALSQKADNLQLHNENIPEEIYNAICDVIYFPDILINNPEAADISYIQPTADRFEDSVQKARKFFNDNADIVEQSNLNDVANAVYGHEFYDFGIDVITQYLPSFNSDGYFIAENGSLVSKAQIKNQIEQNRDLGTYDLYATGGKKPLVIDGKGKMYTDITSPELGITGSTDTIVEEAQKQGYTSVVINNVYDMAMNDFSSNVPSNIYVVFDPSQVKSATDNIGTYDKNGRDILYDLKDLRTGVQEPQTEAEQQRLIYELMDRDSLRDKAEIGVSVPAYVQGIARAYFDGNADSEMFTQLSEQVRSVYRQMKGGISDEEAHRLFVPIAEEIANTSGKELDTENVADGFVKYYNNNQIAKLNSDAERIATDMRVYNTDMEKPFRTNDHIRITEGEAVGLSELARNASDIIVDTKEPNNRFTGWIADEFVKVISGKGRTSDEATELLQTVQGLIAQTANERLTRRFKELTDTVNVAKAEGRADTEEIQALIQERSEIAKRTTSAGAIFKALEHPFQMTKTVQNTLSNPFNADLWDVIDKRMPEFMYQPITNEEEYQAAQAEINLEGIEGAYKSLMQKEAWDGKDTIKALSLSALMTQLGMKNKAVDIQAALAKQNTRSGRQVQANMVAKKMSKWGAVLRFDEAYDNAVTEFIFGKYKRDDAEANTEAYYQAKKKDAEMQLTADEYLTQTDTEYANVKEEQAEVRQNVAELTEDRAEHIKDVTDVESLKNRYRLVMQRAKGLIQDGVSSDDERVAKLLNEAEEINEEFLQTDFVKNKVEAEHGHRGETKAPKHRQIRDNDIELIPIFGHNTERRKLTLQRYKNMSKTDLHLLNDRVVDEIDKITAKPIAEMTKAERQRLNILNADSEALNKLILTYDSRIPWEAPEHITDLFDDDSFIVKGYDKYKSTDPERYNTEKRLDVFKKKISNPKRYNIPQLKQELDGIKAKRLEIDSENPQFGELLQMQLLIEEEMNNRYNPPKTAEEKLAQKRYLESVRKRTERAAERDTEAAKQYIDMLVKKGYSERAASNLYYTKFEGKNGIEEAINEYPDSDITRYDTADLFVYDNDEPAYSESDESYSYLDEVINSANELDELYRSHINELKEIEKTIDEYMTELDKINDRLDGSVHNALSQLIQGSAEIEEFFKEHTGNPELKYKGSYVDNFLKGIDIPHISQEATDGLRRRLRDVMNTTDPEELIDKILDMSELRHTAVQLKDRKFKLRRATEQPKKHANGVLKRALRKMYNDYEPESNTRKRGKTDDFTEDDFLSGVRLPYVESSKLDILREVAVQQIFGALSDTKSNVAKQIRTAHFMTQLLSGTTFTRNVLSEVVYSQVNAIESNIAILPDFLASLLTGKRTIAFEGATSKKAMKAAASRANQSYVDTALGINTLGRDRSQYGMGYGNPTDRAFKGKTRAGRVMATGERIMGYSLSVTDEAIKGHNRATIKDSLDKLDSFTEEEKAAIAAEEADYRVFQSGDNPISLMLEGLRKGANSLGFGEKDSNGSHTFGVGDLITTYTFVPGDIAMKTFVHYSPLGAVRATYIIAKSLDNARKKTKSQAAQATLNNDGRGRVKSLFENVSAREQREAMKAIIQPLTGAAILYVGYALAKAGIAIFGDKDDYNEQLHEKSKKTSSLHLNISQWGRVLTGSGSQTQAQDGDDLLDLTWAVPFNSLFMAGADLYNKVGDKGLNMFDSEFQREYVNSSFDASLEGIESLSLWTGVNNMMQNAKNTDTVPEFMAAEAADWITSFTPSIFRQIANATDDYAHDPYKTDDIGKLFLNRLLASSPIPKMREGVPYKVDVFGEIVKNTTGNKVLDVFNNMLFPSKITKYNSNAITDEITRLADMDSDILPTTPYREQEFEYHGKKYTFTLNDEDYQAYAQLQGQAAYKAMYNVITAPEYNQLTDGDKIEILSDLQYKVKKQVKYTWADLIDGKESVSGNAPKVLNEFCDEFKTTPAQILIQKKAEAYLNQDDPNVESIIPTGYYTPYSDTEKQQQIDNYTKYIENTQSNIDKVQSGQWYKNRSAEEKQEMIDEWNDKITRYRDVIDGLRAGTRQKYVEIKGNWSSLSTADQDRVLNKIKYNTQIVRLPDDVLHSDEYYGKPKDTVDISTKPQFVDYMVRNWSPKQYDELKSYSSRTATDTAEATTTAEAAEPTESTATELPKLDTTKIGNGSKKYYPKRSYSKRTSRRKYYKKRSYGKRKYYYSSKSSGRSLYSYAKKYGYRSKGYNYGYGNYDYSYATNKNKRRKARIGLQNTRFAARSSRYGNRFSKEA